MDTKESFIKFEFLGKCEDQDKDDLAVSDDLLELKDEPKADPEVVHEEPGEKFLRESLIFTQDTFLDSSQKAFLVCEVCNYKTDRKGYFSHHMLTHTGEKLFWCNICDYSAVQREALKYHILAHTGEKPFTCNVCNFATVRKGDLVRHRLIHTGEKRFHCRICGYKTTHMGHLKRHMHVHSGEKPFNCALCKYSSIQKSDLVSHMQSHTKEYLFSCESCDFTASRKDTLRTHVRRYHKGVGLCENRFVCKMCKRVFKNESNLECHLVEHRGAPTTFSCHDCTVFVTQFRGNLRRHMQRYHRR